MRFAKSVECSEPFAIQSKSFDGSDMVEIYTSAASSRYTPGDWLRNDVTGVGIITLDFQKKKVVTATMSALCCRSLGQGLQWMTAKIARHPGINNGVSTTNTIDAQWSRGRICNALSDVWHFCVITAIWTIDTQESLSTSMRSSTEAHEVIHEKWMFCGFHCAVCVSHGRTFAVG